MNNVPCLVCAKDTQYFLEKDGYTYNKCFMCGFIFLHPMPEAKHLSSLYTEESGYQAQKKIDLSLQKESKKDHAILEFLQEKKPNGKLLDVGCSNGKFLYFAKKRSFETWGVEVNKRTARIGADNGLNISVGTLADAQFPDGAFDSVFLGDVIEHLANPQSILSEIKRILRPGCTLVVSTPNLASFWSRATFLLYRWFSIPWSSLTPPHHVLQFSENNAILYLEKQGFIVCEKKFFRPPPLRYELGMLHLLKRYKQQKSIKSFLFLLFAFVLYAVLYAIDYGITSFKQKDFTMVLFAEHAETLR